MNDKKEEANKITKINEVKIKAMTWHYALKRVNETKGKGSDVSFCQDMLNKYTSELHALRKG